MSFDCGLRGMTKWQHNSSDNDQSIMYPRVLMWVCIYLYVRVCVFDKYKLHKSSKLGWVWDLAGMRGVVWFATAQ